MTALVGPPTQISVVQGDGQVGTAGANKMKASIDQVGFYCVYFNGVASAP